MRRTTPAVLAALLSLAACGTGETSAPASTPTAATTAATQRGPSTEACADPAVYEKWRTACEALGIPAPPGLPTGPGVTPMGVDSESSAATQEGRAFTWANGLQARLVSVEAMPSTVANADPAQDAEVLLRVEFTNTGTAPVAMPRGSAALGAYLLYGINRERGQRWGPAQESAGQLPERLVPGTSAVFVEQFTMPSSGLNELAFRLEPVVAENYGEHTWTDVQNLLPPG